MRVLVTGASGHVGGAIAAHLVDSGHDVIGLSRHINRKSHRLERTVAADIGKPGLASLVASGVARCDVMVHAAATLDKGLYAPTVSATNGLGTQQVLELAAIWEVSSFIYISGVSVIGRPRILPVDEEHPAEPTSAYLASKLYGEQLVGVASRQGLPATTLRLSAPVGPGMPDGRIMSVFVRRALIGETLEISGRGTRQQDYVDVRDVAAAAEAALSREAAGVLNIASANPISNLDLAKRCVEVVGSTAEVIFSQAPDAEDGVRWEISIGRARERIGYVPQRSIEDSIRAVADDIAVLKAPGAAHG